MTLGENYYYGGLLRFDLSPKPAYFKIKELLQKRWHTEAELVTDKNGSTEFRGFYGDYSAVISSSEEVISTKISLSKTSENSFDIIL
jgi:hypothetical protein